ncbi:hypothetical protein ACFRCQ_07600 [Cytobacillus firmus]|uniref:hypothetical protein n=1 Tax=Cytobacillus firmus TaxID=1399 RepID=UPI003697DF0E
MKKIMFAIGSFAIAGSLFAGYSFADTKEDPSIASPEFEAKYAPKMEEYEAPGPITESEVDGRPLFALDSFQVQASEYSSLDSFVQDIAANWAEGSEYRSYQDDSTAEFTLANSTLHYINYFEDEIKAKGMTKEFEELQLIAYDIHNTDVEAEQSELADKFEDKLNAIVSKF